MFLRNAISDLKCLCKSSKASVRAFYIFLTVALILMLALGVVLEVLGIAGLIAGSTVGVKMIICLVSLPVVLLLEIAVIWYLNKHS